MDEFHGIGGSYILDPKTGKRTPAPKVEEKEPKAKKEPKETPAANDQTLTEKD